MAIKSLLAWHERMMAILPDFGWPYPWVADRFLAILAPWILTAVFFGLRGTARGFRSRSRR